MNRCSFLSNTVDTDAQFESARELMRIQISVLTKLAIDNFNIKYLTELTRKSLAEGNFFYTESHYDRQVNKYGITWAIILVIATL